MQDYRHVHLRGIGEASERFQPRTGGSKDRPNPVADRQEHARRLRRALTQAVSELPRVRAEQARYGIPPAARGMPLAVEGRSDEEVEVGDLKLESRGLQLLNVQRNKSGSRDVAVFFVKANSAKSLLAALDKYEAWEEEDGQRPQRFWLFESADEFRLATVEDLWTDPSERLPGTGEGEVEWEAWVRRSAIADFLRVAKEIGVAVSGATDDFVDMAVVNVRADRRQIAALVRISAAVVELRGASNFSSHYHELDPEERITSLEAIVGRVVPAPAGAVRTTILDTGVNAVHPLLAPALPPERCRAIRPDWVVNDHDGHGTKMAGVALYGDLEAIIDDGEPVNLSTEIESVVVTAPSGMPPVPAHVALREAVGIAEQDPHARVYCLAATAPGDADDGRQTSTSAAVDKLAWNDGDATRLICVAAGNVRTNEFEPYQVSYYEARNEDHRLESPGQALNALTVGAVTEKCPDEFDLLAPPGDLCPTSRTTQQWEMRYANKPDIVMEGGNHVVDEDGECSRPVKETMVMTTGREVFWKPVAWVADTSAATARAAGMATRLASAYPNFRAETLRGMMVHSARWTDAMEARYRAARRQGHSEALSWASVLDCFGWGVPTEERLFASAGNALTLIIEDELQPFTFENGRVRLREMKYFRLPWPRDELRRLNQEDVQLRCTLSYFAEPDPHAGSRHRLDRYASHRLRFDLKSPNDTHAEAQRRINTLAEIEDGAPLAPGAGDRGWCVGANRRGWGSLHHDVWSGKAFDLAERDGVTVFPVRGWWADRREPEYYDATARFSLIVSISTRRQDVDLVAETMANIAARNLTPNLVENVGVIEV